MEEGVRVEINYDPSVWRNIFLNNQEIHDALYAHGKILVQRYSTSAEPFECHIRVLNKTQVARVRPKSQALSDEQKKQRRRTSSKKRK